jgi:hypothetical protein
MGVEGGGLGFPGSRWPLCTVVRIGGRGTCGWAIGAAPRPLGQVHGGNGGCAGRGPIAFAVAVSCHRGRRWWVVRSPHEVSAALFCMTLGLSLADGGSGVCPGDPPIVVVVVGEALGVISGLPGHSMQSASRISARRGSLPWAWGGQERGVHLPERWWVAYLCSDGTYATSLSCTPAGRWGLWAH